ncbi:MAG TPA: glycosyltransferase [bacterium]|nr:glycosyltransferase [bacterium]
MRELRIVMCSESYLPRISGVTHALAALTRGLRERGHRVVIAAPRYPGHRDDDPDIVRFPSLRPPHTPDFPLAVPLAPVAWRRLIGSQPDVVHSHAPFLMGAVAARLARRTGRPLIFTYHTLYDEYVHYAPFGRRQMTAAVVRRYVTAYANRCAVVVAPSHAVADRLRGQGVTARIEVVPTATIDPAVFAALDPSGVRAAYGLPADAPLVVTASRLAPEKSVDLVLEAFAHLAAGRSARLLVVGGGPAEAALRAQAERLGLAGRVVFTGLLPHRRALECLAAGDLFLYASRTETQGLVVAEAMAAGLPVVAVDAGGVSEAVVDGRTGFLVGPEAAALAAHAALLLDDEPRRQAMASAARAAAAAYSVAAVTERMIAVYESARGGS